MRISIHGEQPSTASDNEEKHLRRRLTVGFFFGFLAISLFGCSANNNRDAVSINHPQHFAASKISKNF